MDSDEYDFTVKCPFCGEDFYDDVDQCPHCQQYVSASDFKKKTPTWVIVIIIAVIVSMLFPTLTIVMRTLSAQ